MTRKQHFLQHWIIGWLFRTFVLCKCKQLPCHETERRVNMNWENYSLTERTTHDFLSRKSWVSLATNSSLFGIGFADWPMWPTNRSYFHSCVLSFLAFEWKWGWRWPRFDRNLLALLILMMQFWCWLTGIYIQKQQDFYQNRVTSSLTFIQRPRGPISRKSWNFSGDKKLFVSSIGTRFVLWNFAVILSFLLSETY